MAGPPIPADVPGPNGMLPSLQTIGALLGRPHYIASSIFILAITFGITYGITYNSVKESPYSWVLLDTNEIVNIVLTTLVMAMVLYMTGLRMTRKRIVACVQPPLASEAFSRSFVLRYVFFSLGVIDWRKRFALFLLQCAIFPMAVILVGLGLGCQAQKKKHDIPICWMEDLHPYLAIGATYRAVLIWVIFTYSYISSHNDAQPELADEIANARGAATTAAIASAAAAAAASSNNNGSQAYGGMYQHPSSAAAAAGGGYPASYAPSNGGYIPTGQVVHAIPVEMNLVPNHVAAPQQPHQPMMAPQGYQQQHQPMTGGNINADGTYSNRNTPPFLQHRPSPAAAGTTTVSPTAGGYGGYEGQQVYMPYSEAAHQHNNQPQLPMPTPTDADGCPNPSPLPVSTQPPTSTIGGNGGAGGAVDFYESATTHDGAAHHHQQHQPTLQAPPPGHHNHHAYTMGVSSDDFAAIQSVTTPAAAGVGGGVGHGQRYDSYYVTGSSTDAAAGGINNTGGVAPTGDLDAAFASAMGGGGVVAEEVFSPTNGGDSHTNHDGQPAYTY